MSGPLDPAFFAAVQDPSLVGSWLLALVDHVDAEVSARGRSVYQTPELLVAPPLLRQVEDRSGLVDALFDRGVRLSPYPGEDSDLVDLVDGAGYANLLYLPPPPYCREVSLVEAHNLARWSGAGVFEYPPLSPDLSPRFVEAFITFLGDGMSPSAAWSAAELLS